MFILEREYLEDKTIGKFYFPDGEYVYSLERPWKDNKPNISCIPEGEYVVDRDTTGRHQWYSVRNVEGRTFIEIHIANRVSELQGCIALGLEITDRGTLLHSRKALEKLLNFHGDDSFILQIKEKGK